MRYLVAILKFFVLPFSFLSADFSSTKKILQLSVYMAISAVLIFSYCSSESDESEANNPDTTQYSNFSDVVISTSLKATEWLISNTSIDSTETWFNSDYICWIDGNGDADVFSTAICVIALLEQRQSSEWNYRWLRKGYTGLSLPQREMARKAVRYLIRKIPPANNEGRTAFWSMAIISFTLYLETGGPDNVGEATTVLNSLQNYVNQLKALQNPAGYWADNSGNDSMHLTYLATSGLGIAYSAGIASANCVSPINYVLNNIMADGGCRLTAGGSVHPVATAESLGILWNYGYAVNDPMIQKILNWLHTNYDQYSNDTESLWAPFTASFYLWVIAPVMDRLNDNPGGSMIYGGNFGDDCHINPSLKGYSGISEGWLFDFYNCIIENQDSNGRIVPPVSLYSNIFIDHSIALIVLESSLLMDYVDFDGDGVCTINDNCPCVFNPTQIDSDMDNIGDHCDID